MTTDTVRATAQAMPADHLDAAIFALARECEAAVKDLDAANEALGGAEERCRHLTAPPDALRTEKDHQLGLFVGNRVGTSYGWEDVPVLRALVRAHSVMTDERDMEVWKRACDILDALRAIKEDEAREGELSGLTVAEKRSREATDAWAGLAERLAKTRAQTIEGIVAKTRAMRFSFEDDRLDPAETISDMMQSDLRRQGLDGRVCALSLACDLIALAEKEGAR